MVVDEHGIGILMEDVDGWEGDMLFPVAWVGKRIDERWRWASARSCSGQLPVRLEFKDKVEVEVEVRKVGPG